MADEVELFYDGEGIAVIGDVSAVARFLDSLSLSSLSQELQLDRLGPALATGSKVMEAAAYISENAGRYVKLTKESFEDVKRLGLMPTKTPGVSHAMLGRPGSVSKWIQIEDGPASLLMNPVILSGVAGIMAQLARQQEAKELKRLLVAIDAKLDDVRRRQRDEVLAKLDRAILVIDEATTIREHGGDRETTWEKVRQESATIAEVQANALRSIEALADKTKDKTGVKALAQAAQVIEEEVGLWIAALARCCELQDKMAVLELDHVLDTAPLSLDGHRLGINAALEERRNKIIWKTTHLVDRLDKAGAVAQANVLLHARSARAVVNSINAVAESIDDFHVPFDVDADRTVLTNTRWRDAVRDPMQMRNAAAEVGPKVVSAGLAVIGTGAMVAAVKSDALNASRGRE